jgi:hypothetical protein
MEVIVLILASIGIGIIASALGVGGGTLLVPFLILLFHLPANEAIGTALWAILSISFSSSLAYYRLGKMELRLAGLLIFSSVLGAYFGAVSTSYLTSQTLKLIFGIVLLPVSSLFIIGKEPKLYPSKTFIPPFGMGAGFAGGLLGIGGGFLLVPFLASIGVEIRTAIAVSLFSMIAISFSGALTHFFLGNLNLFFVALLVPGCMLGAQVGPRISVRIPTRLLRTGFGILLFYVALRMIL